MKSISITRLKHLRLLRDRNRSTTWNEKYLDYEIETYCRLTVWSSHIVLKWKVSRLRDWNSARGSGAGIDRAGHLKWKVSRLRDWNKHFHVLLVRGVGTWNEKYLDYEIETDVVEVAVVSTDILEMKSISITRLKLSLIWLRSVFFDDLEMKSISITRLKLDAETPAAPEPICLKWKVSRLRDWNYVFDAQHVRRRLTLEMKSISITRLKHWNIAWIRNRRRSLKWKVSRLRDWNIFYIFPTAAASSRSWNEKYLDYEIETNAEAKQLQTAIRDNLEMKSISITRLKHHIPTLRYRCANTLKWKVSRLRDWNKEKSLLCPINSLKLEMKSISITRLKPFSTFAGWECKPTWNEKYLDYEIETVSVSQCDSEPFNLKWKVSRLRDWNV